MSNRYEDKVETKRQRYATLAQQKAAEAKSLDASARQTASHIPMGQPILVGHHSEKKHRRDIKRISDGFTKAFEAQQAAEHYTEKAKTYRTHGINSDDPEAISKVTAQIAKLEAQRAHAKTINAIVRKAFKKAGADPDCAAVIDSLDVSTRAKTELHSLLRCWGPVPRFLKYDLTNVGANIRRYKKRLATLQLAAARPVQADVVGAGYRIEENAEDNRVRFFFDERPSKDVCQQMRRGGFLWSPRNEAWQRKLTPQAVRTAKSLALALFGTEEA